MFGFSPQVLDNGPREGADPLRISSPAVYFDHAEVAAGKNTRLSVRLGFVVTKHPDMRVPTPMVGLMFRHPDIYSRNEDANV